MAEATRRWQRSAYPATILITAQYAIGSRGSRFLALLNVRPQRAYPRLNRLLFSFATHGTMSSERAQTDLLVPEMSRVLNTVRSIRSTIQNIRPYEERDGLMTSLQSLETMIESTEHRMQRESRTLVERVRCCERLKDKVRELLSVLTQIQTRTAKLNTGRRPLRAVVKPGSVEETANATMLVQMKMDLDGAVSLFEGQGTVGISAIIDELRDVERRGGEWQVAEDSAQFIADVLRASAGYQSLDERKREPVRSLPDDIAEELQRWPMRRKPVYFLSGAAETSKSAIAYELCVRLHTSAYGSSARLGASFFFSDGDLDSSRLFFPALVYQLQQSLGSNIDSVAVMREYLQRGDQEGMSDAFKHLFHQALAHVSPPPNPLALVIDGIDQCKDREKVLHILVYLLQCCREFPWLHIFISSRPHPYVMAALGRPSVSDIVHHQPLPGPSHDWAADARRYLEHCVPRIPSYGDFVRKHPEALRRLVRRARGDLTFARVSVEFLDQVHDDPEGQFKLLLSPIPLLSTPLDTLYRQILKTKVSSGRSPDQDGTDNEEAHRSRLSVLLFAASRIDGLPLDSMFLNQHDLPPVNDLASLVDRLRCVSAITTDAKVILAHKSFREFLLDERRCPHTSHIDRAYICFTALDSADSVTALLAPFPSIGPTPAGCRPPSHPLLTLWPYYLLLARPDNFQLVTEYLSSFAPSLQLAMYAWVTTPAQAMRAGHALLRYFKSYMPLLPYEVSISAEYFKFVSYVQLWRDRSTLPGHPFPNIQSGAEVMEAMLKHSQVYDRHHRYVIVVENDSASYNTVIGNKDVRVDITMKGDDLSCYRTVMETFVEELHRTPPAAEDPSLTNVRAGTYRIEDWVTTDVRFLLWNRRLSPSRRPHSLRPAF